jgi:rare lipoprotein A
VKQHRASFAAGAVIPILLLTILLLLLTGCGHPKQVRVDVPPPPASTSEPTSTESPAASHPASTAKDSHGLGAESGESGEESGGRESADLAEPAIPAGTASQATEIGQASWYGPPYHNRRGSNGEVYNMHAMTAAHRTLPLGSIVRVTNLKTGHSALVRITDRGPFIAGRVLDLSLAAARKVDVYLPGVAEVKVEVMQTPAPIETGGKWAVQIGGFPEEDAATKLADHLTRRYRTAKVLRFNSPAGDWWVRVRVLGDDRERARKLAAETKTREGAVFLVRLD